MIDEEVKQWVRDTRKSLKHNPNIEAIEVTAEFHAKIRAHQVEQNKLLGGPWADNEDDGTLTLQGVPVIIGGAS